MKLSKINNQWWITDCPPDHKLPELPGIGPYDNRWDAEADLEGLERYDSYKPREISVDSPLCRRGAVQLVLLGLLVMFSGCAWSAKCTVNRDWTQPADAWDSKIEIGLSG